MAKPKNDVKATEPSKPTRTISASRIFKSAKKRQTRKKDDQYLTIKLPYLGKQLSKQKAEVKPDHPLLQALHGLVSSTSNLTAKLIMP